MKEEKLVPREGDALIERKRVLFFLVVWDPEMFTNVGTDSRHRTLIKFVRNVRTRILDVATGDRSSNRTLPRNLLVPILHRIFINYHTHILTEVMPNKTLIIQPATSKCGVVPVVK